MTDITKLSDDELRKMERQAALRALPDEALVVPKNHFKEVASEFMTGMRQGGPPAAVARGVYAAVPPLAAYQGKAIEQASYKGGEVVTDAASKAGLSPQVAGGLGWGANVALGSIPMLIGGGFGAAGVPLQNVSKGLMQSALKPTIAQLKSGDAAVAVDTMLNQGINVTRGGIEKIRNRIDDLNENIKEAIAASPETVQKSAVGRRLVETLRQFRNQVNPGADIEAIKKVWAEFKNHPLLAGKQSMPVSVAQDLKQGTNRILRKKYGQLGTAEVEGQKGLVRGLKEEIAAKVPGVAGMNAEESALIKTLDVAERRVLMDLNKNPGGLAWLTTNPAAFAAFMADKSALFKSLFARAIYSGAKPAAASAGRASTAGGIALSQIGNLQHGH